MIEGLEAFLLPPIAYSLLATSSAATLAGSEWVLGRERGILGAM